MIQHYILIGMGGLFIILGLLALFRGRGEEKTYYNGIGARRDVREFVEHQPERPEPGALRIGGYIAIAVGLIMLAIGGGFLIWG